MSSNKERKMPDKTIYPAIFNTPPTGGEETTDTFYDVQVGISHGAPQWPQDTALHYSVDGGPYVDVPVSDRKNDFDVSVGGLALGPHTWDMYVTGTDVDSEPFSQRNWVVVDHLP